MEQRKNELDLLEEALARVGRAPAVEPGITPMEEKPGLASEIQAELDSLRNRRAELKKPETSLLTEAITSLGPALAGLAVGGAAGYGAAAPATKASQEAMEQRRKENLAQYEKERLAADEGGVKLLTLQRQLQEDEANKESKKVQQRIELYKAAGVLNDQGEIVPDPQNPFYQKIMNDMSVKELLAAVGLMGAEARKSQAQTAAQKAEADRQAKIMEIQEKKRQGDIDEKVANAQIGKLQAETKKIQTEAALAKQKPEYQITGYKYDPTFKVSPTEVAKLRTGLTDSESMITDLRRIQEITSKAKGGLLENPSGVAEILNPFGADAGELQQLVNRVKLLYKSEPFANLGVLTGPDMQVLEDVLNSTNLKNLATRGGADALIRRYEDQIRSIKNKLDARMEATGFTPISNEEMKTTAFKKQQISGPQTKRGKDGRVSQYSSDGKWRPVQ